MTRYLHEMSSATPNAKAGIDLKSDKMPAPSFLQISAYSNLTVERNDSLHEGSSAGFGHEKFGERQSGQIGTDFIRAWVTDLQLKSQSQAGRKFSSAKCLSPMWSMIYRRTVRREFLPIKRLYIFAFWDIIKVIR